MVWTERHQKAAAQVIPEGYGAKQIFSRPVLTLGHSQRRGYNNTARMCLRHRLEIVGLVRVREHTGGQRRINGRRPDVRGWHRNLGRASLCAHVANSHLTRL